MRIIPDRLKEARIIRRYTIEELASKLCITKQAVSKYEIGKAQPSREVLIKIIDVLKVPISFLTKEDSINIEIDKSSFCFRTLKSTKLLEKEYAKIRLKWAFEISNSVFDYLNENIIPNLPDFSFCRSIEDKALLLRKHWGLEKEPINNLTLATEKNGILIFNLKTDEFNIDAYSQWLNEKAFIVVNSLRGTAVRWRFDIAHEIGHLVLHKHIHREDMINEKIEKEANLFANEFLIPSDVFKVEFISDKLSYFIELKRKWGVSISAILYKAGYLQLINEAKMLSLNRQISSKGWRKSEPLDDEIEYEKPVFLAQKLESVVRDKSSASELVEKARMAVHDIEDICQLKDGFFEDFGLCQFTGNSFYEFSPEPVQLSIFD